MFNIIELSAVVSSAIYGVLLARRHEMDFVGVFCMAFIISFGGGTVRDLFLDRHPLFRIQASHYPIIVFVIAILTSLIPKMPERLKGYLSIRMRWGWGCSVSPVPTTQSIRVLHCSMQR